MPDLNKMGFRRGWRYFRAENLTKDAPTITVANQFNDCGVALFVAILGSSHSAHHFKTVELICALMSIGLDPDFAGVDPVGGEQSTSAKEMIKGIIKGR